MYKASNQTVELLTGELDRDQTGLLFYLFRNPENKVVLDEYLKLNTVNKKTRDFVCAGNRSNKKPIYDDFYNMTEEVYKLIEKNIAPDTYVALADKLKQTETKLERLMSELRIFYWDMKNFIVSNNIPEDKFDKLLSKYDYFQRTDIYKFINYITD